MPTTRFRDRLEAHQLALYLGAIVIGLLLGAVLPGTAEVLEIAVEPSIAALLLVTFHGSRCARWAARSRIGASCSRCSR